MKTNKVIFILFFYLFELQIYGDYKIIFYSSGMTDFNKYSFIAIIKFCIFSKILNILFYFPNDRRYRTVENKSV